MPVTPAKLTVKISGKNSTITLLNEGEINLLKKPGLTEISVTLVFPVLTGSKPAAHYLELLEKAKTDKSKSTTKFILTRTSPSGNQLFDTNIKVSVEDYSINENAEKGFDLSVDIKLKQYKEYSVKKVTLPSTTSGSGASGGTSGSGSGGSGSGGSGSAGNGASSGGTKAATVTTTRAADSAPKATTYTVKSGDTLWALSSRFYGNGALYTRIFDANRDKIQNPNLIYVGQVLTIPDAK